MVANPNSASPDRGWRLNRREQVVALVVLASCLLGAWLPGQITVATSASLDHRVFLLRPVPAQIETDDYLVFRHRDLAQVRQGLGANRERMIKRVGCRPSQGRPLPRFIHNGPVPAGQLFLVGTHPRSYDSRYFGFVDAREILHQALPLW
jgi:type IV secretory pathway protease TraF